MSSPPAIAVVRSSSDPQPSFISGKLRPTASTQPVDDVHSLYFFNANNQDTTRDQTKELSGLEDVCRRLHKKQSTIVKLRAFLFGKERTQLRQSLAGEKESQELFEVGDSFFFERNSRGEEDLANGNTYWNTTFRFPSPHSDRDAALFSSNGSWNFRCSDIKSGDRLSRPSRYTRGFNQVHINTGICLFSNSLVLGTDDSSQGQDFWSAVSSENCQRPFEDPDTFLSTLQNSALTLYELESLTRLSAGVSDHVALISHQLNSSPDDDEEEDIPIRVNLDVPRVQYYYLAFQAVSKGHWTVEQGLRWIDIVRERASKISRIFEEAIHHGLKQRVSSARLHNSIEVSTSNSLDPLESLCEDLVRTRQLPDMEDMLQTLAQDARWSTFIRVIRGYTTIQKYSDLAVKSYVFQLVQPLLDDDLQEADCRSLPRSGTPSLSSCSAFSSRSSSPASDGAWSRSSSQCRSSSSSRSSSPASIFSNSSSASVSIMGDYRPRRLLLSIENPSELMIFASAEKVLKDLRHVYGKDGVNAVLIGAFAMERIFTSSESGKTSLYMNDPGQVIGGVKGDIGRPIDLLKTVYTPEYTDCLEQSQAYQSCL